jgi:hypothetical protein
MALKRKCQTCYHFQDADLVDSGWCHHPKRRPDSGALILVRGNELACRDEWGCDLWLSALGPGKELAAPIEATTSGIHVREAPGLVALLSRPCAPVFEQRRRESPVVREKILPLSSRSDPTRRLRVFLCHASNDKLTVRNLYVRLVNNGLDPWFDEENLLPGQDWQEEIPKAVRASDVVIVCLSSTSVTKTGYVQKELRYALDVAQEQPEGSIFLIPLRLEDCVVPDRLQRYQWADLHAPSGFDRLMRSLVSRAGALGLKTPS